MTHAARRHAKTIAFRCRFSFLSGADTEFTVHLDAETLGLVARHLRARHGRPADWTPAGLSRILEAVREVNQAFCPRLNSIAIKDASVNALVVPSTLGDEARMTAVEHDMERRERIFGELLD